MILIGTENDLLVERLKSYDRNVFLFSFAILSYVHSSITASVPNYIMNLLIFPLITLPDDSASPH